MKKTLLFALTLLLGSALAAPSDAVARGSSRSHSSRSSSARSGGYYRGPRQPSGQYANGAGSSHKGGTYKNPYTGNHYQKRK